MASPASRRSERTSRGPHGRRRRGAGLGLVALAALIGCKAQLKTADGPPAAVGVVAEPISTLPTASGEASHGDGAATLRTPVATEVALALVRRLFEAFHARNMELVRADFEPQTIDLAKTAFVQVSPWGAPQPTDVFIWLKKRVDDNPFDQLDVELVYKPQAVEVYANGELGLPGRPTRPAQMGEDDLLVRIPIVTPRVGTDALFGDEIRLILRRSGGQLRIHGYGEVVPK